MALLALVIAILIERYYHSNQSTTRDKLSSDNWYFSYSRLLKKTFGDKSWYRGWVRESVEVFIPTIAIFILFKLFDDGFIASLIVLALMVLILVHAFGPQLPSKQLENFFKALEDKDDPQAAYEYAKTYTGKEADTEEQMIKQVTDSIFYNVESQYFSVAIWFVFLGPAGALLYRMLLWQEQEASLGNVGKKVLYFMEWVACRVSALCYLLAGDMAHGIDKIKSEYFDLDVSGKKLLIDTAVASMGQRSTENGVASENHCAISLSQRSGVILFAVIAIASLLGWTFV
ncbi:regulatory signaling modulator protein AmpE [Kangiella sediminilitoris]|uniref:Signaling modulator of AmpD, AmpE n=1 Tax=Kangiella sediminilitoris TaxID=1144748 RepID=A0A1B3BCA2_9GAMM|nr:regulatory signaling modulator protein AmpE [Kangiella sediminilitoris]AOE50444.1 Signaling modulator of AmpD, AmpE [Kangiella sediminilitoris]